MATPINPAIPSGPYTLTWGTVSGIAGAVYDLGLLEGPIRFQQSAIGLPVRASLFAQNIIDYIMQGGGYFGVVTIKERTTGTKKFLWPFGANAGIVDEPGLLFSHYCDQLIATAVPNTPAATYGPVTRTANLAAVLPGHNLDEMYGAVERNIVVALGFLPERYSSSTGFKLRYLIDT